MSAESGYVPGCPFCAIARDSAPGARVVAAAPAWVAFFPPEPATPGHTLIIPRVHVADLWSADAATAAMLAEAAVQVGRAIRRALQPPGLNLITSAGEAAEQTVFHLHVHVVPRRPGDGFGRIWPPKGPRVARAAVDDAFERIRRAWEA